MKIRIDVKEEHIINGKCADGYNCAIALAIKDLFPNAVVGTDEICFSNTYDADHNQSKFVTEFDKLDHLLIERRRRLNYVQPFSFEIEVDPGQIFQGVDISEVENIINGSLNCKVV